MIATQYHLKFSEEQMIAGATLLGGDLNEIIVILTQIQGQYPIMAKNIQPKSLPWFCSIPHVYMAKCENEICIETYSTPNYYMSHS